MHPIAVLGAVLEVGECRRVAAALTIDSRISAAVENEIKPARHDRVRSILEQASRAFDGSAELLSAALTAMAEVAARTVEPPQLVWSGPGLASSEGRTTRAVADLIDSATDRVLATTYSASLSSPFVQAMAGALHRGVQVTVVVDTRQQREAAKLLAVYLGGAEFWTLTPATDGGYAVQHSKVLIVDDKAAFVTSANFSEAAADRNLECGLVTSDARVVRGARRHFESLQASGALVPYAWGG